MPTKDRPDLLTEAVRSLQAQTYERWELWIVNDGGEDLASAVHDLDDGSRRIHHVRLGVSRGAGPARNVALALARGKYVTYLDDDDWLDPPHLEGLVDALESTGQSVAYTDSRRVFETRGADGRWRRVNVQEPYHARDFSREALLVDNYLPILAIMHRRSCLDEVGLFDEALPVLEDWELWIRMSRRYDFVRVPQVTCSVRWRDDASSTTTGRRHEHYPTARLIHRRYEREAAQTPSLLAPRAQLLAALGAEHARCKPTCSVVVVTSPRSDSRETLAALADHAAGVSYEVVLVDNGTGDAERRFSDAVDGEVRQVVLPDEVSLGEALQRGAAWASADVIAFLDADVVPQAGWLSLLIAELKRSGALGVAGKLLAPTGRVVAAGMDLSGEVPTPLHRGAAPWAPPLGSPFDVDAFGAGMFVMDRKVFDRFDGFADRFCGALAVVELTARLREHGSLRIEPRACGYVTAERSFAEEDLAAWRGGAASSPAAAPPTDDGAVARLAREAREAMMAGDYGRAAEVVRHLEREAQAHPETWLVRGVLAMQLGEHQAALESFTGARERGGNPYRASLGMGMALTASGRFDEAWGVLRGMSDAYPNDRQLAHALFRVGVALRDWGGLLPPLSRYLEHDASDQSMRFALASVCLRAGDRPGAQNHYARLRAEAPTFAGLDDLAAELE